MGSRDKTCQHPSPPTRTSPKVVEVAEVLDALSVQALGLVDDDQALLLAEQLHEHAGEMEAVVPGGGDAGHDLNQRRGHQAHGGPIRERRPTDPEGCGAQCLLDGEGLAEARVAVHDSHRSGLDQVDDRPASQEEVVRGDGAGPFETEEMPAHYVVPGASDVGTMVSGRASSSRRSLRA